MIRKTTKAKKSPARTSPAISEGTQMKIAVPKIVKRKMSPKTFTKETPVSTAKFPISFSTLSFVLFFNSNLLERTA